MCASETRGRDKSFVAGRRKRDGAPRERNASPTVRIDFTLFNHTTASVSRHLPWNGGQQESFARCRYNQSLSCESGVPSRPFIIAGRTITGARTHGIKEKTAGPEHFCRRKTESGRSTVRVRQRARGKQEHTLTDVEFRLSKRRCVHRREIPRSAHTGG